MVDIIMEILEWKEGVLMIDFREEMSKYKPVRTVEEVETSVKDEIMDMMDILQHISHKSNDKV